MTTPPVDPQTLRADDSPRPAGTRGSGSRRRAGLPAAILAAVLASAVALASPAQEPQKTAQKPAPQKPAAKPALPAPATPAPAAKAAPAATNPHEKGYVNVKVLQGLPISEMAAVMHIMRASLGVRCDYCHVIEGEQYELDTKPAKERSREMLRMVFALNKEYFAGSPVVTCQTCHHGKVQPDRVPALELGLITGIIPTPEEEAAKAKVPTAVEVLDHYIEALGGRAALERVHSRVSRGSLLHLAIVNAGTPQAHGVNRGQADPLEIVQRPPQVTVTYGPPGSQVVQTYDGKTGRVKTTTAERAMTPEEVTRLLARTDLRRELKLRDQAESSQVIGKDQIDGRQVFLLRTTAADGNPTILAFDAETGLLRRQSVYRPTVLGPDPEQTDYEDYRDVGGVKVPFLIKTSALDDFHTGTTRKLAEVRDNVE